MRIDIASSVCSMTIDETGTVVSFAYDSFEQGEGYEYILALDVKEHLAFWRSQLGDDYVLSKREDICDFGWFMQDGTYDPPSMEYRADIHPDNPENWT